MGLYQVSRSLRFVTVAVLGVQTAAASAQASPRPFVEAGLGLAYGVGGDYYERLGPAVSLTIGTQPHDNRSLVLALHTSFLNWGGQDDIGYVDGRDRPYFPFAIAFAALIGGRPLSESATGIEWMAGPALLRKVDEGGSWTALLVSARIGGPPGRTLSPGVVVRSIATTGDGTLLVSTQVGVGFRFW